MLNVRRTFSGSASMDVVVFFRRSFSGKDEQVYPATFTAITDYGPDGGPGIVGLAGAGTLGYPGSDDTARNWVIVQYDQTGAKPFVKKGGYVTDVDNLRWYRIVDIVEGTPATILSNAGILTGTLNPGSGTTYVADAASFANTNSMLLRLEAPVAVSGNQPAAPGGVPTGKAMLMRNVVSVYPIRTQLVWEN